MDVEIVDSSPEKNVYLSKKGINGETRLAITAHAEGEVGVCFKNYVEGSEWLALIWLCGLGGREVLMVYMYECRCGPDGQVTYYRP